MKQETSDSPTSEQQFEDFDKFFKRELPHHLQEILAEHLQSQPEPVKEFLTKFLDENLRESTEELYRKWQLSQGQAAPTPAGSHPGGNMSFSSPFTGVSSANSALPPRSEAVEARLMPFYEPTPAASNVTSLPGIDRLASAAHGPSASSDSAYFSNESVHGQSEQNTGSRGAKSGQMGYDCAERLSGPLAPPPPPMQQSMANYGEHANSGGFQYLPHISRSEQFHGAATANEMEAVYSLFPAMTRPYDQSQGMLEDDVGFGSFGDYGNRAHDESHSFANFPDEYRSGHNDTQRRDAVPVENYEEGLSSPVLFDRTKMARGQNMEGLLALYENEGDEYASPK